MRRRWWVAIAVFVAAITAWGWWLASQPPVRFVPLASITMRQPINSCWLNRHSDRHVLVAVTIEDPKAWRIKTWRIAFKGQTLVGEPVRLPLRHPNTGFFDFDGDGCGEFFAAKGFYLWIFKRRENVRVKRLPPQTYPSWFLMPKSQWVLWGKIPLEGFYAELSFFTEPDPHQPRKVVVWEKHSTSGGPCLLLSRDGRRLHPFTKDEWHGVERVEDLDHDGVCELILDGGRSWYREPPAHKGIYKWDGRTYRLWWPTEKRDGYVLYSEVQDLDGDGTKDIVAVLDTKGAQGHESPFRALVVYRLQQGRYRKVVQCPLPQEPQNFGAPLLVAVLPLRDGALIMLERADELLGYLYRDEKLQRVWRFKSNFINWHSGVSHDEDVFLSFDFTPRWVLLVHDWLPSRLQDYWWERFHRQPITLRLVWDGANLREKGRWRGMKLTKAKGTCGGKFWVALARKSGKVWHHTVMMTDGQRFRKLWHGDFRASPDNVFGGDLDGDGDDELIVMEAGKGKISVFKAEREGNW